HTVVSAVGPSSLHRHLHRLRRGDPRHPVPRPQVHPDPAILAVGRGRAIMNGAVVRRFLGIIVCALGFSASAVAQSSDQPFSKWFKYNSTAAAKWQFTGDPADPLRVAVRRKDGPRGTRQTILVRYPRSSSAYDIEMYEILRVLEIKEHNPDLPGITFELKDS